MGTYSVDAKDAGKGEREKRVFFFTFPVIPTKIAPIALESLTNLLERARVRGRTSIQMTQVLMSDEL